MKKIYFETIKKWGTNTGIAGGGAIVALLFMYLVSVGAIEVISYSKDSVCAGTEEDPCYAVIEFLAKEDIYVYPSGYDPWGRNTSFDFEPAVKEWTLQRSWGSGWRSYDLTKTCPGTWCGLSDKNDERKFSLVWREGRSYKIRIVAYKNSVYDNIKWSAFDGKIDPFWFSPYENETNVSWDIVYFNKTVQSLEWHQVNESYPVYNLVLFNESCDPLNMTCFNCTLNMTVQPCKSINKSIFDHWGYHWVNRSYLVNKSTIDKCRRKAIIINEEYYPGIFNIHNDTLYEWFVPQECRNWDLYPWCRDFEVEKGICTEKEYPII